MDALIWLGLLLMTLLAGAVVYLFLNQRHFQRVDYGHLLDQEERLRQLDARIAHLERLIADLALLEQKRRQELDQFVAETKNDLRQQLAQAQQQQAERAVGSLPHAVGIPMGWELEPPSACQHEPVELPSAVEVPLAMPTASWRQQEVIELLEQGCDHQDISRLLGVSRHEIKLVETMLFGSHSG